MGHKGFITCNGADIYYEVAGTGETVVFLHGAPLDSRMWEPQMKSLSNMYQVLRFDMRGMGQTIDPGIPFALHEDIHALLQQLNINRASFVGASFGSYAGVEFALAHPEMVERLILVCPGGFAPPSADRQRMYQQVQEQIAQGNMDEALEINLHISLDGPSQERGRVQLNRKWLKEIYQDIFTQAPIMNKPKWLEPDPRNRLPEVATPTLVISGQFDHPDFIQTAEKLASLIPDSELYVCKNSAHFPSIDSPKEIHDLIVRFLNQPIRSQHT